MATLTETEIERIRDLIGDDIPDTRTSGFDLTDTQIQAEWDTANGHASELAEYRALYNMIRRRRGKWVNNVDTVAEGSTLQNQKLRNIERLLAEYRDLAGIGSFTMSSTAGTFDFGLDQDDPITGEDLGE
jgi:hypothetical protein